MRRSTSTRAARVGALLACAALLTAGCGTQQTPAPGTLRQPGRPRSGDIRARLPCPGAGVRRHAADRRRRLQPVGHRDRDVPPGLRRQLLVAAALLHPALDGGLRPPLPVRHALRRPAGPGRRRLLRPRQRRRGHPLPAHRDDVPRRCAADRRRRGLHVRPVPAPDHLQRRQHRQPQGSARHRPADGRLRALVRQSDVPERRAADHPDPVAQRRRGRVRRLRVPHCKPCGGRSHEARRHDRRGDEPRDAGVHDPGGGGGDLPRAARGAALPGGLLARHRKSSRRAPS